MHCVCGGGGGGWGGGTGRDYIRAAWEDLDMVSIKKLRCWSQLGVQKGVEREREGGAREFENNDYSIHYKKCI